MSNKEKEPEFMSIHLNLIKIGDPVTTTLSYHMRQHDTKWGG